MAQQLEVLQRADSVRRIPGDGAVRDPFSLNHERAFALVDDMCSLSKLRPPSAEGTAALATLDHLETRGPELPSGPRILLAYGRDEGVCFGLGTPQQRWRIGRAPSCEIRLDYEAFLSATHAAMNTQRPW